MVRIGGGNETQTSSSVSDTDTDGGTTEEDVESAEAPSSSFDRGDFTERRPSPGSGGSTDDGGGDAPPKPKPGDKPTGGGGGSGTGGGIVGVGRDEPTDPGDVPTSGSGGDAPPKPDPGETTPGGKTKGDAPPKPTGKNTDAPSPGSGPGGFTGSPGTDAGGNQPTDPSSVGVAPQQENFDSSSEFVEQSTEFWFDGVSEGGIFTVQSGNRIEPRFTAQGARQAVASRLPGTSPSDVTLPGFAAAGYSIDAIEAELNSELRALNQDMDALREDMNTLSDVREATFNTGGEIRAFEAEQEDRAQAEDAESSAPVGGPSPATQTADSTGSFGQDEIEAELVERSPVSTLDGAVLGGAMDAASGAYDTVAGGADYVAGGTDEFAGGAIANADIDSEIAESATAGGLLDETGSGESGGSLVTDFTGISEADLERESQKFAQFNENFRLNTETTTVAGFPLTQPVVSFEEEEMAADTPSEDITEGVLGVGNYAGAASGGEQIAEVADPATIGMLGRDPGTTGETTVGVARDVSADVVASAQQNPFEFAGSVTAALGGAAAGGYSALRGAGSVRGALASEFDPRVGPFGTTTVTKAARGARTKISEFEFPGGERGQMNLGQIGGDSDAGSSSTDTVDVADTSPNPGTLPGNEGAGVDTGGPASGGDPWPDHMLPEGHPLRSDTPGPTHIDDLSGDTETPGGTMLDADSWDVADAGTQQFSFLEGSFGASTSLQLADDASTAFDADMDLTSGFEDTIDVDNSQPPLFDTGQQTGFDAGSPEDVDVPTDVGQPVDTDIGQPTDTDLPTDTRQPTTTDLDTPSNTDPDPDDNDPRDPFDPRDPDLNLDLDIDNMGSTQQFQGGGQGDSRLYENPTISPEKAVDFDPFSNNDDDGKKKKKGRDDSGAVADDLDALF